MVGYWCLALTVVLLFICGLCVQFFVPVCRVGDSLLNLIMVFCGFIFFFQAEDGIRAMTGGHTFALPISWTTDSNDRQEKTTSDIPEYP